MDFSIIKENLTKKGFTVRLFETKEEADAYLNDTIQGKTIGVGGSVTVKEMGLYDILKKNNQVYWHGVEIPGKTRDQIRMEERSAEIYLSSVNAIAETGEIVNIDGSGNRVSDISFGHQKVFLLVGRNKITKDLKDALYRAKNVAAPKNAKRLNRNTPCAKEGDRCYDCHSPECICRIFQVITGKPKGSEYEILLINEDLGY